ncbi:hypothetical protein WMY93_003554 [Mugilogobius chulae]|uniref:Uncharacterized protein n=1 Tax=Mugilogobius chulae TaxID=88201 RepID=A0AAW0PYM1_9GOBI
MSSARSALLSAARALLQERQQAHFPCKDSSGLVMMLFPSENSLKPRVKPFSSFVTLGGPLDHTGTGPPTVMESDHHYDEREREKRELDSK